MAATHNQLFLSSTQQLRISIIMICGKLGKCFHGEINDGAITGIWNTHLKLCSPKLTKEKHF